MWLGSVMMGILGILLSQFDGDLPLGHVSVEGLVIAGKAPVNGSHLFDSGIADPFDGTDPQIHIWINGILNHHGNIHSPETIGYILYSKRIG